jgi:hypothetical protein
MWAGPCGTRGRGKGSVQSLGGKDGRKETTLKTEVVGGDGIRLDLREIG